MPLVLPMSKCHLWQLSCFLTSIQQLLQTLFSIQSLLYPFNHTINKLQPNATKILIIFNCCKAFIHNTGLSCFLCEQWQCSNITFQSWGCWSSSNFLSWKTDFRGWFRWNCQSWSYYETHPSLEGAGPNKLSGKVFLPWCQWYLPSSVANWLMTGEVQGFYAYLWTVSPLLPLSLEVFGCCCSFYIIMPVKQFFEYFVLNTLIGFLPVW